MAAGATSQELCEWLGQGAGALPGGVRLAARPLGDGDEAFLRTLYATTRDDVWHASGWRESRCRSFIDRAFAFHQRRLQLRHAGALQLLLLVEGRPVGRLAWDDAGTPATLLELSLLPAWRGRGLGGQVLRRLAERADALGQAIALQLPPNNPACRLAQRLGFAQVPQDALHLRLQRLPAGASMAASLNA